MNDLLNKLFKNINLSDKQKVDYINSINISLAIRILESIYKVDKSLAVKLAEAIKNSENNPSALQSIITELKENKQMKELINITAEKVMTELLEEISKSATEEQKQQILASLSS
jgi:hypothetical protein